MHRDDKREDGKDEERLEQTESLLEKQRAAAAGAEDEAGEPEQDETDSTFWDTDEHSDAPGPTGTG
jgi:hypothetical protein